MHFIRHFLKTESAGGVVLFIATLVALIWSNSPLADWYQQIFNWQIVKPISFWINDGLMALFFLLIGLELKREFLQGKLNTLSRVTLPAFAAVGGMIFPALIYIIINFSHPETLKGWAIPVATDIAFALGVLTLFGKRISLELKLFLMTLAIFDDLGAILIIAFYHSQKLNFTAFLVSGGIIFCLSLMNRCGVKNLLLYGIFGLLLWYFILRAGVHPTLAGVVLAFVIPLSAGKKLEKYLHPLSSFFIMPLFALANAGLALDILSPSNLLDYVALGIILGLVLGKPIGVLSFTYLIIRNRWGTLPQGATWPQMWGVAVLCGIGFTMSLFLGNLAFEHGTAHYQYQVRLGVLSGSVLSGILGALFLFHSLRKKGKQA